MSTPAPSRQAPHYVRAVKQAEKLLAELYAKPEHERDYRIVVLGLSGIASDAVTENLIGSLNAVCGLRIIRGPFAGMQYLVQQGSYGTIPAVIGAMEVELQPAVEALIASKPRRIVNVGCGNGYYTVGFARRLPETEVIGVDIDATSRLLTEKVATMNDVADRVAVEALSTHESLQRQLGPGTALFMDCEGAEKDLLDPALVPALKESQVIVEMHDFVFKDIKLTDLLVERFSKTHDIQLITATTPDAFAFPEIRGLPPFQRWVALNEGRPYMQWMVAKPKAGS